MFSSDEAVELHILLKENTDYRDIYLLFKDPDSVRTYVVPSSRVLGE